ncbi:MAG: hypothetical protein WAU31_03965, partial [Candidatus Moraniibacteriota bacterium]
MDITKSCTDNATACCKTTGTVPPPPSVPAPTPSDSSNATSCSGKDASGATQSGTCSTSANCSSGTALTGVTGCTGGGACCFVVGTTVEKCVEDQGGTCEMVTSCAGTPLGQFDCSTGQT